MADRDQRGPASGPKLVVPLDDQYDMLVRLYRNSEVQPNGCWLWCGAQRSGYGMLRYRDKRQSAHRLMYAAVHGEVPEGMVVMHACDTPECINPDHLSIGTMADNQSNMAAKGRAASPMTGQFKLTVSQCASLRADYAAGGFTHASVGRKYGVSYPVARRIIRGEYTGRPDDQSHAYSA